jgi:pre-peptidase
MRPTAVLLSLALLGCSADEASTVSPPHAAVDEKNDSSLLATVLDFEWDGELLTDVTWSNEQAIRDQLLYTIGHLNADHSVGRLDRLVLTNVKAGAAEGKTRITYHARMPVAWGSKTNLPTSYAFTLPRDVSSAGTMTFTDRYKASCVDFGAHDVDQGSMWYYFRPRSGGCNLAAGDVVKFTATVTVSSSNTTGKYPEYDKVWEDGALNVVAVFGKFEDGATGSDDAGIAAFNEFVAAARAELGQYTLTTTPAEIPDEPGVGTADVQLDATLPDGKKIQVVALLVDNVRTTDPHFTSRYEQLSTRADLIAYNGHAGLGQNVRALARRGQWVAGQYVIVFMNGCDTFAYVDGSLAQTRAAINADDPSGSKYLDFVVNAMPAFFASDSTASMSMIRGLASYAQPKTYEQIFAGIDSSQVVLVTGEEDNAYRPAGGGGGGKLLDEKTSVGHGEMLSFKAAVTPGSYLVALGEDSAHPGGDADLYVRLGAAPTMSKYDCRPWVDGNNETCRVTVTQATTLFVSVNGYSQDETFFTLSAVRQ